MRTRRATPADCVAVVETLAASHEDYVWERWTMPDEATRPTNVRLLMGVAVEFVGMVTGEVWMTDDASSAVVWLPPKSLPPPPDGLLALTEATTAVFGSRKREIDEVTAALAVHHRSEPCWFLATMGTLPGFQGNGAGSSVIRPVLDRLDESGEPAMLETSSADNVRFYERHGFVVDHFADDLPYGAPPTWIMWRAE